MSVTQTRSTPSRMLRTRLWWNTPVTASRFTLSQCRQGYNLLLNLNQKESRVMVMEQSQLLVTVLFIPHCESLAICVVSNFLLPVTAIPRLTTCPKHTKQLQRLQQLPVQFWCPLPEEAQFRRTFRSLVRRISRRSLTKRPSRSWPYPHCHLRLWSGWRVLASPELLFLGF